LISWELEEEAGGSLRREDDTRRGDLKRLLGEWRDRVQIRHDGNYVTEIEH